MNDLRILQQINKKKNQNTYDILKALGIPQTTLYREIQKLKKLELISITSEKGGHLVPHYKIDIFLKKV
jgi:predicted transcriptional regulator